MTKINKLSMKGFKSFADRIDMVFEDKFNCILGPNGSGKCVTGDTRVYLADGSIVPIKDIVSNAIKSNKTTTIDDGYIAGGDNTKILCLDTQTLKLKKRNIQAYVKRTSPKKLVNIRTKSGRRITTTTYHPLFIMTEDGIKSVNAQDLNEGLRIAVPRILPETKKSSFIDLIDLINVEDGLFVPFDDYYPKVIKKLKKGTWANTALKLNIPLNAIKGLLDGQSINFVYLIRILKASNMTKFEMIKQIKHVKSKTSKLLCKIPWYNSKEFSRLLGYLIAEGRLTQSNQVWFTNSCDEIVKDYLDIIKKVFGFESSLNEYKPNCYDVITYSKPMQIILSKFGMSFEGTAGKQISNIFLTNSSNVEVSEFLNGLYCGDGYVSKNSIEIVTKSPELCRGIEILLLRLGITYHSKFIIKTATNTGFQGVYKQISVYGVNNFKIFYNNIKLIHPMKKSRLLSLIKGKSNPNVDLIDNNLLIKRVANDLKINIKKTKKAFPRLDSYVYNQSTPSRVGITDLVENLFSPVAANQNCKGLVSLQKLSLISHSDILWDEIIEMEEIDSKEKWVYDLCVEKDHNFVAENIFIHNSNVLDALCFVLGKGSAKGLRAEKSANLIYNGGKTKNPAKEGEVSIYFDNKSKIFPISKRFGMKGIDSPEPKDDSDYSDEIKITRVIKGTGQSKYHINDKTVTKQQILDLLSMARINPDGYNIVLQGDIVRLVEMSPIERRGIIEEISGISVYEDKKNKALSNLDKVEERLNDAELILSERETYLKELRQDRDSALKFKKLKDRVDSNNATYLHLQIQRKDNQLEAFEKHLKENKTNIDKYNSQIKKFKTALDEKQKIVDEITKEVESRGEKDQVDIHKQVENLKVNIATNKTRIDSCKNELERIKTRKDQLNNNLDEISDKLSSLEEEKTKSSKEMQSNTVELSSLKKKMDEFKKKNKLDDSDNIEKEIDEIDKSAEDKQKEVLNLRERQQNLLREKDQIEYKIEAIDNQIEKVLEVEKEHKKEIDNLKQKRQEFKKATLELNTILDNDSSTSAKLGQARSNLLKVSEDLARIKAQSISIAETLGANSGTKKILENKSKFGGVFGLVSEIGKVNSKYSLALEIAAGAKLKSLVVESDQVASKCIKFLKDKRLGIATFLPLNKIRPIKKDPATDKLANARGCHGYAIDLVSYDNKFKNVFSYVFGNTLVVDNIDVARRIGIGTAKMVTLDGDMSERSGAMHGGYRKRERAGIGFSQKEVSDQKDRLEKESAQLNASISKYTSQKQENEDRIQKLREFKANLEGEIIKLERSLHLDSGDLQATKRQKELLRDELKIVDKKVDEIMNLVSKENKSLADMKIKKAELRAKITQLRNPRLLAEFNSFEQKNTQLKEDNAKLDNKLRNIDMQISSIIKPEHENIKKILKQNEKEEIDFQKEIKELQDQIKLENKDLKSKEEEEKKFFDMFKDLFNKRNKVNDEIRDIDKKLITNEEKIRTLEQKNNFTSVENSRVKAEIMTLKEQYERYKNVELLKSKTEQQLKREISEFERMMEKMGNVNMRALEVYDNVEKEYKSLMEKKDKLKIEREDVMSMIDEIEKRKNELFMKTYNVIEDKFTTIFNQLSAKGHAAEMVLETPDNPLEGGLTIQVRITGKKTLDIRSLSGGEKTMTALSFLFAVQENDPASFYIMDEVDAALDKHNSEKLAKLVRQYADGAQYIIISHNDAVISEADSLYGVSMNEHGMTKVTSLQI